MFRSDTGRLGSIPSLLASIGGAPELVEGGGGVPEAGSGEDGSGKYSMRRITIYLKRRIHTGY